MYNTIDSYYKYIYREQLDFRYRLYKLSKTNDLQKSIDFAQELIYKAFHGSVGYFASSELEKPFLRLAQTIDTDKDLDFKRNSFLHVMTQAYTAGGHTRVVERWIDSAPADQKHSVVILKQNNEPCPLRLYKVASHHGGDVYLFNENSLDKRAKLLRDLGCQYEYVVLHIHMWDPTAIVAFGKDDFLRPVIFFNHADHLFWCGSSVVDMLADLRDNNFASVRGISNRFSLRIPFEQNKEFFNYRFSKSESRKRLGLPQDKTIILTTGGPHKYNPFTGKDFCSVVKKILINKSDVICVGVGPTIETGLWSSDNKLFMPIGPVDYDSGYVDYLNACDIYIDSIPLGGGVAMLDALQFRKPVLSYSLFKLPLGDIIKGVDTIYDESVFEQILHRLIENEQYRQKFAETELNTVLDYHGIDRWKLNVEAMISKIPSCHSVNRNFFKGRRNVDDLCVMDCQWFNSFTYKTINIHDVWHQVKCFTFRG